ncbi:MAG: anthranilate synthase component I family protein [Bacteroidetes bacterium]|nr:anthranilate synthase component I family protein [Bacteroidota bacterium]
MNNDFVTFPITGTHRLKERMLNWADQFNICSFLDNHRYHFEHHSYECLAGIGALHCVSAEGADALDRFTRFRSAHPGWLFGHLNYELQTQPDADNPSYSGSSPAGYPAGAGLKFPALFFFVPEIILLLSDTALSIASYGTLTAGEVFARIQATVLPDENSRPQQKPSSHPPIRSRFSRQEYIDTVEQLRGHILRGDCYEINFCQEFFAEQMTLDPLSTYRQLSEASPNPFGGYYKLDDQYLLCASPERYLKKQGRTILSQPIKGTSRRSTGDRTRDEESRRQLYESSKDRSENVMVVDLVRNDLTRICHEGSVQVGELFGIYSFPTVHQMISTISGELCEGLNFADILRASFPMGSMTGAPKKRVMELIKRYERTPRGLFSGALGYITPEDDFDFNVVIRSILYNQADGYLSYQVGSGITFYSNAEQEYEECMLKAEAIKKVLGSEL